jgi:hypothetical protein
MQLISTRHELVAEAWPTPIFQVSIKLCWMLPPGGLRSLAAAEVALGLASSAVTLLTSEISGTPPGYDGA